jgi:hypothetical protein
MIQDASPLISSIRNREIFISAFSQYDEGPALIIFTEESCPGAVCGVTERVYEKVAVGEYEACFGVGPAPVGSQVFVTCQGAGDIVLTFEDTELIESSSPDCTLSDPNLWRLIISFDSIVHENCVVTSLISEGNEICDNACA